MITLQYLEPGPHIGRIMPEQARKKLRAAFEILSIDCLLLGWDLPPPLKNICREETARAGVKLFRWHPLLTGDGTIHPLEAWRTRNVEEVPLPGFRGLPEFTFVCPNHPAARDAILTHLTGLAQSGIYDGIFLDRMRFPSPAENPWNALACFCEHCHSAAVSFGLDFGDVRRFFRTSPKQSLLRQLSAAPSEKTPISAFLDFRQQAITAFLRPAIEILRAAHLDVGLDCFSPSLARMVGQDLSALASLADWTKLMIYGHARGPATLPYEIGALVDWLMDGGDYSKTEAVAQISETLGFPHSASRSTLYQTGFSPDTLMSEYRRGRQSVPHGQLLAGIELVEMPGVSELNAPQIEADLRAFKAARADGLSLSWDLWQMPLARLALVAQVWGAD